MRRTKFYKRISTLLISVLFIACFSLIIFAQEVLADDIGLKVYDGSEAIPIEVELAGASTSPLRIAKDGNVYSIVLVNPGDPKESGLRIQTSSGIMGFKKYVPLPAAYVSLSMSRKRAFRTWDIISAMVTVTENTASGPPIVGATVQGRFSGGWSGNVSGTTNTSGQTVRWWTDWVPRTKTATFTVNSITKDGDVYELAGTLSATR